MKNKLKTYTLVPLVALTMGLTTVTPIYASNPTTTDNGDGTFEIEKDTEADSNNISIVDGNHKNDSSSEDSTDSTKGSTNNTYTPTAAETELSDAKKDMVSIFRDLLDNADFKTLNQGNNYPGLVSFLTRPIDDDLRGRLLDDISLFQKNLIKTNSNDKILANTSKNHVNDYDSLNAQKGDAIKSADTSKVSNEDLQKLYALIMEKEGLTGLKLNTMDFPFNFLSSKHQGLAWIPNLFPIRDDLVTGGFKDCLTYADRLGAIQDSISILENTHLPSFTNSMEDWYSMTVLRDFHLSDIDTQHVSYENYSPDNPNEATIRWELIDKNTGEVLKSDTGNYTHMKYSGVKAGDYQIKTYQHKVTTSSIRAYYDIREYVIDTLSGTVLYSRQESLDGGGEKYVDIQTSVKDEWVPLDNDNVTLNNLGEIVTNTTGTERIE